MSHESGITISEGLKKRFQEMLVNTSLRFVRTEIVDEHFEVTSETNPKGTWEEDLDMVPSVLEATTPAYILYRTDEKDSQGSFRFLVFYFVPDKAKVRPKMLYSSSRAKFRSDLGIDHFIHEIFGTKPNEFTRKGYETFIQHQNSPAPLTEAEELKEQEQILTMAEANSIVAYGGGSTAGMQGGVTFPANDDVIPALASLEGGVNYVQLGIDTTAEVVVLIEKGTLSEADLSAKIPTDGRPAFHFYRWDHQHEGESLSSLVFVYSCPNGANGTKSATVKDRMLYSSSKGNIVELFKKACNGRQIDLKLEINVGNELTADALRFELHPPKVEKKVISKPKVARKLIR